MDNARVIQLEKPFDKYFISDNGDVLYLKSDGTYRARKLTPDEGGYLCTTLAAKVDGQSHLKRIVVKNLVAQFFVPNPDNLKYVEHVDGDKTNVHYTNLRWTSKIPRNAARGGLNAGIRVKCVETGQTFYSGYSAAQKFGISPTRIYQVLDRGDRTAAGHHFVSIK